MRLRSVTYYRLFYSVVIFKVVLISLTSSSYPVESSSVISSFTNVRTTGKLICALTSVKVGIALLC
ncbi:hypothetical protein M514_15320 [Trichuris suis]|uniref:Uncharacterized protein n=1 Tax=Trichuris suis TaxID=68888 RepID=A0A085NSN8_9BILA|nr:hypothetical protein M514_15320 [Trichuris suis]